MESIKEAERAKPADFPVNYVWFKLVKSKCETNGR